MSFWFQVAEVIGVSAIVSAVVNAALEQWKYKKERMSARQEEHLKYSVENYPNFAMILTRVNDALISCEGLYYVANEEETASDITREDLYRGVSDLLYFLGTLFKFEQDFKSKQGQMFRLTSQSMEMVADSLYGFVRRDMLLSETQCVYLAQSVQGRKLKDFRDFSQTDPEVRRMIDGSINMMLKRGMANYVKRSLSTLGRLLTNEIDRIRLPGYERKIIPLSKDQNEYIEGLKRIPDITFMDYADPPEPIRIQIYNNWDHEILWKMGEPQFKVCKRKENDELEELATLEIFDPEDPSRQRRSRIGSGETLRAEWPSRPNREEKGEWVIQYLPGSKFSETYYTYGQ